MHCGHGAGIGNDRAGKANSMRILVVGAVEGGSVQVGTAIYSAFKAMGEDVQFLDFSDFKDDFVRVVKSQNRDLSAQFLMKCNVRLMKKVLDFGPDAILGIAQSPMVNAKVLIQLRKTGIILCFWFVEDYRVFDYWKTYAHFFNHYFTIQKEPFWRRLRELGCRNFHYLPMAFDTDLSGESCPINPDINVSFVGAPYPNRIHFFDRIDRCDFQIYGDRWSRHGNGAVVIGDRWVSEAEARSIYQRSIININLHSSQNPVSFGEGDFVNPRTFELAGLGVFQLTDVRELMPLHFELNEEIPALRSWEEMKRAIDYFLGHDNQRRSFIKKAQRRVFKEHTYRHRAQEILEIISSSAP